MTKPNSGDPPIPEGSDFDPDVYRVMSIYNGLQRGTRRYLESLSRKTGLSERSLYILELVRFGADRPSRLIEMIEFLPSTITFQTDKLVAAGLITREPLPEDRRVVVLKVTPKGEAVHREVNAQLNAFLQERLKDLESWELETFIAIGRKIVGSAPQVSFMPKVSQDTVKATQRPKAKARVRKAR